MAGKTEQAAKTEQTAATADAERIERQKEQQKKFYLSPKEMAYYILSGVGDKNWDTFNASNSDFYYRTIIGAEAATLSTASVICTFADTFDNAISGPVLDRTRTRWGRVRPYLVLTLPLWLIANGLPWLLPTGLSQIGYLIIFAVLYYIGSVANSFYTPAYSALLFNLTPNVDERNRLIAADTYVDLLGVWIPSLFPFFVDFLPASISRRSIYMVGAGFFIALVVIFRIFGFFSLRERVPLASRQDMNEVGVLQSLKMVATCQPMWILMIKNFFAVGKSVGVRIQSDFWLNCFGKVSYSTITSLFTGLPAYFVLPLAPKLTKKIGLKNLGSLSYGFCGVCYLIMYLIGYNPFGESHLVLNLVYMTVALTIAGSMNSIQRYCSTALTGDMYDYVEWKTGVRNEGIMSAATGYISLISNQAATLISGGLITALGIKSKYIGGQLVRQTDPTMLRNIWTVFALAPAIGRIAKAITLWFFCVHGKTREQMMHDLAVTRAAKVVDTGKKDDSSGGNDDETQGN
ncbi:MAG: MFS transporter [Clostridiales bacterium]|nr:MFS transporter [Clostridiales bacterium]